MSKVNDFLEQTDSVRTGRKERGYCKQLQEMQSVLQYFYPKNQYSLMKFSSNLFILEGHIFVSGLAQLGLEGGAGKIPWLKSQTICLIETKP